MNKKTALTVPYFLLRLLPMWDYICPRCRRKVTKNSHECTHCGEHYGAALRVPPRYLKDPKTLEAYVHKHVFPRISTKQQEYLAQFFTELFSDGFESGSFSAWTGTQVVGGSTIEVVSTQKHHGTYSAHALCDKTAGQDYAKCYKDLGTLYATLCMRIYVRFAQSNTTNEDGCVLIYFCNGSTERANLKIKKVGTANTVLSVGNYEEGIYYDSAVFTTALNTWYCAELNFNVNATTGWFKAFWDGVEKVNQTNKNTGTTQLNRVYTGIGWIWAGVWENYVDCVVVADVYIGVESETFTKTWTSDTLFKKLGIEKTSSIDVLLKKKDLTSTLTTDVLLKKLGITNATSINTLLKKLGVSKIINIDILLKKLNATKTANITVLIKLIVLKAFSIDAVLKKGNITNTFSVNVALKKLSITKTSSIDALLKKLDIPITASVDALFSKLGITKIASIDVLLKKANIIKTIDLDVLFKKQNIAKTLAIDTIFKKLDILKTFGIDVNLLKKDIAKTLLINAILKATFTKTMNVDVLLKKFNLVFSFALDSLLKKTNIASCFDINTIFLLHNLQTLVVDTVLKKNDVTKNTNIDVLMKKLDLSLSIIADACFEKTVSKILNVDLNIEKTCSSTFALDTYISGIFVWVIKISMATFSPIKTECETFAPITITSETLNPIKIECETI